jgi:hypothetical protein
MENTPLMAGSLTLPVIQRSAGLTPSSVSCNSSSISSASPAQQGDSNKQHPDDPQIVREHATRNTGNHT